jgi:predicted NBD/HSP70 family sugar kinase/biotin operon repressor
MSTAEKRDTGSGLVLSGFLRPRGKALPGEARRHNTALVLQTLYRGGPLSRADLARETGLTRVTISDLVAELLSEGLVTELGTREGSRPGKPATLVDIARSAHQIIGIDLSDSGVFRGAVLGIDGDILERAEVEVGGATGDAAVELAVGLATELLGRATAPVLGVGVGSPGIVDLGGTVLSAPNLGWTGEPLRERLAAATGQEVLVANDANAAALAEHSFGGALGDTLVIRVGRGVGAGLLVGGIPVFGARFAAGELGHVVVGTDGGALCACGKRGCLETWLAVPRLEEALSGAADDAAREALLREAGHRLGIALAPVVGVLDLSEIVLSGPAHLLDGPLSEATHETLRDRTMAEYHDHVTLRGTRLGQDIVLRGAAAMVLSGRLGVS